LERVKALSVVCDVTADLQTHTNQDELQAAQLRKEVKQLVPTPLLQQGVNCSQPGVNCSQPAAT
jgi:hypothetical protein